MVWFSTCLVMSSSLCISPAPCTLCWPAVITAKQIFVKKYRTMIIIISKSRFGSISTHECFALWFRASIHAPMRPDEFARAEYTHTVQHTYFIHNSSCKNRQNTNRKQLWKFLAQHILVNLRNRTGEKRRRQTLSSLSFKQIFLYRTRKHWY